MDALTTIDYLARARDLAPMLAAAADDIERLGELPAPVRDTLIEQGFFRMLQPRSLGGAELRPAVFSRVTEQIAKVDGSTAWVLCQGSGCSMSAAYLAAAAAREIFGPATGILAWGPPMGQQAHAVAGGYRVSGTWRFASGSHHASWLGAHALLHLQHLRRHVVGGAGFCRQPLCANTVCAAAELLAQAGRRGQGSV